MKNFLTATESSDSLLKDLSYLIYRTEAHIYRGEIGPAAALLATIESEIDKLHDTISLPVTAILVGLQLGFMSGGSLRGRIPGAIAGGIFGWMYAQNSATHTRLGLDVIEARVNDLRNLLALQARRLAEESDFPEN